jgi:hypothetical protein
VFNLESPGVEAPDLRAAMTSDTTKADGLQLETEAAAYLFDNRFDPLECGIRERVRGFIDELIRQEFDEALACPRYGRRPKQFANPSGSRRPLVRKWPKGYWRAADPAV